MKRRWGRKGLTLSDKTIWLLAQAVVALLFITMLFSYIDTSVKGGLIAKQFYPAEFGLLASTVAQCPDNMVMSATVDSFKGTRFSFEGAANVIGVTANSIKGTSKYWVFTPSNVGFQSFNIPDVTGLLYVDKEGAQLTLRKDPAFYYNQLNCPGIVTTDANGLAKHHVIDVTDDPLTNGVGLRLEALIGKGTALFRGPPDGRDAAMAAGDVVISLRTNPDDERTIAYTNPAATDLIKTQSARLGCLLLNGIMRTEETTGMAGAAVIASPVSQLPDSKPAVLIVIGTKTKHQQDTLARGLFDGLRSYYE